MAATLDLRGLRCPLNWAHAKVRLERMQRGEVLDLLIDDPRGLRDIPRAAEAEGYAVLAIAEDASGARPRAERARGAAESATRGQSQKSASCVEIKKSWRLTIER